MQVIGFFSKTTLVGLVTLALLGCNGEDETADTTVEATFSPTSHDFGVLEAATDTEQTNITLTNASSAELTGVTLAVSGAHFSLVTNACSSTLQPAESCTIQVQFSPQAIGTFSGALTLSYAVAGEEKSKSVALTGIGGVLVGFAGVDSIDQVTATSLRINWTHEAGAANYLVYEIVGGTANLIDTVAAPTANYSIAGLSPASTHIYRVKARDALSNEDLNENNVTITTANAPVLTDLDDLVFTEEAYALAGTPVSLDVSNVEGGGFTGNDTLMAYTCVFDRDVDGSVTGGTDCSSLPGTVDTSDLASQGKLIWTPDSFGPFELKFTGSLGAATDDEVVVVDVRQNYFRPRLLLDLDAQFADGIKQGINPLASFANLQSTTSTFSLYNFDYDGSSGWVGDGTVATPDALELDGVDDYFEMNNSLSFGSEVFVGAWINPRSVATGDATILTNGGVAGDGFLVKQNGSVAGALDIQVGDGTGEDHSTAILADSPVGYWRVGTNPSLNQGSAGSDADSAFFGSPVFGPSLVSGTGGAAEFDGATVGMAIGSHDDINLAGPYYERSIELFFTADVLTGYQYLFEEGGATNGAGIYLVDDTLYCQMWSRNSGWGGVGDVGGTKYLTKDDIQTKTIYHVVMTLSDAEDRLRCYVNGTLVGEVNGVGRLDSHSGGTAVGYNQSSYDYNGNEPGLSPFTGQIDEVAIFNSELTPAQVLDHFNPQPTCTTASAVLADDTWALLTATYDGLFLKLFVDTSHECTVTSPVELTLSSQKFTVGRDPALGANYWNGSLAHILVYDQSPTLDPPADVIYLYNATEERFVP